MFNRYELVWIELIELLELIELIGLPTIGTYNAKYNKLYRL